MASHSAKVEPAYRLSRSRSRRASAHRLLVRHAYASASCLGAPSATSGAMSLPSSFESHLESGSCSATHAASRVTPLTRAAPDCSRFSA